MSLQQFNLVTEWRIAAPLEQVWGELSRPDDWPGWWRAVRRVEMLAAGAADGLGAEWRMTWRTALPDELSFVMRVTRIEPMRLIEGQTSGELEGLGRWTLTAEGEEARVRHDWQVTLGKPWMRALAPLLRPAFAWNHGVVMGWGHDDLARRLNAAR